MDLKQELLNVSLCLQLSQRTNRVPAAQLKQGQQSRSEMTLSGYCLDVTEPRHYSLPRVLLQLYDPYSSLAILGMKVYNRRGPMSCSSASHCLDIGN